MATNPLYPIVPCHRVVGSDMSLVGYGGRQDSEALIAKLRRLIAESRGFKAEEEISLPYGRLTVYPAEWVINATREADARREKRAWEQAAAEAADRLQLRLF